METSKTEQGPVDRESERYQALATDSWIEGREEAFSLIREERRRQLLKWGVRTYDDGTWLKVIVEEVGEVSKEMLGVQFARNIEEASLAKERMRKEVIQLAAVCAAMVQQFEKGEA